MTRLVVAEFSTAEALTRAAKAAAERGERAQDALTPFPVPEIWNDLSHRPKRPIGWVMVATGLSAAALAYFMEWYSATIDFPFLSGNRPYNSWQVFLLVVFEASILFSGIAGFIAFARDCRLPSLHHPLFAVEALERATQDRFFLLFAVDDERLNAVAGLISDLNPLSIHEVGA